MHGSVTVNIISLLPLYGSVYVDLGSGSVYDSMVDVASFECGSVYDFMADVASLEYDSVYESVVDVVDIVSDSLYDSVEVVDFEDSINDSTED